MAATDLKTISDEIISLAGSIPVTTTFDGFADIFDYVPDLAELTGSPILVVVPSSATSPFDTTFENNDTYTFNLDVYVADDDNTTKSILEDQMKYSIGHLMEQFKVNWERTCASWRSIDVVNWDYQFKNGYRRSTLVLTIDKLTDTQTYTE
jgi:hypothetical protein